MVEHTTVSLKFDLSIFPGEFLKGKRHGDGLFTYPNGDIYSGCW